MLPLTPVSQRQLVLPLLQSFLSVQQRWLTTKKRLFVTSSGVRFCHNSVTSLQPTLPLVALFLPKNVTTTGSNITYDYPPKRFQQQQLHQPSKIRRNYGTSKSVLSLEAVKAVKSSSNSSTITSSATAPFQYPKAEELFHRIVQRCETIEDARALQGTVYELLGKPLRDFEFYIDGFGGKKSKHGGGSGSGGETVEPVKEVQKIFDVKLVGYDSSIKLKVIKEIRTILPGLGLKEAKELVESAPCTIQKGLQPEQAEAMKQKLIDVGAQIELV